MNKSDLVTALSNATGANKSKVSEFLDALIDTMRTALKTSGKVNLTGLGTFTKKVRKARNGRNPRTGAVIQIPEKSAVRFSPAKGIVDILNTPTKGKK